MVPAFNGSSTNIGQYVARVMKTRVPSDADVGGILPVDRRTMVPTKSASRGMLQVKPTIDDITSLVNPCAIPGGVTSTDAIGSDLAPPTDDAPADPSEIVTMTTPATATTLTA